jgi:hypothetical protein
VVFDEKGEWDFGTHKKECFFTQFKEETFRHVQQDKKQKDAKDIEKHLEHNSKKKHLDTFNKIRKLHAIVENLTLWLCTPFFSMSLASFYGQIKFNGVLDNNLDLVHWTNQV